MSALETILEELAQALAADRVAAIPLVGMDDTD
jgi:hypothetical protein